MKTIVAGSRGINDYELVARNIRALPWIVTEIVSGGCRGVDLLGERYARENGIPCRRFPADWDAHGKAAGPIRNRQMAEYADALLALWDGGSKGTDNMIQEMYARDKTVKVRRCREVLASQHHELGKP